VQICAGMGEEGEVVRSKDTCICTLDRKRQVGGRVGDGAEMTQTMYAHVNK
jgi:hypothetical protein